ncbi:MAG TPA: hypothetical protein VF665_24050, partial [Longimicrobium sp.]|uniref:hypothetical protein n=1 Tax=Longimicrobium sp. TaxID=2029185 RepID=UPI002ED9DEE9
IVLALVGISAILILPAAYALWALRQVHDIAQTLDARDVEATDAYGDLVVAACAVGAGLLGV